MNKSENRDADVRNGFNSLRGRYLYVATLIILFVLISMGLNRYFLGEISQHSTQHFEMRNNVASQGRLIQNSAWQAEYALFTFWQYPSAETREKIFENLDLAIKHTDNLGHLTWPHQINGRKQVASLKNSLLQLYQDSKTLAKIRTDARKRFPAMRIMEDEMVHMNASFLTHASQAIDEIASQTPSRKHMEIFERFAHIQHDWMIMINAFRAYISTRMGAFGDPEQNLAAQAKNVEMVFQHILSDLDIISDYDEEELLDLQAKESFLQMKQLTGKWYSAYQRVRIINDSDNWRADLSFVRQHIYPTLNEIHAQLEILDNQMDTSASSDLQETQGIIDNTLHAQLFTAIILTLLIVFGFYLFNTSVLQPIAKLAHAFREMSTGKEELDLPQVNISETKQLISAFTHMHQEVNRRQQELQHQALHDALTHLPNRNLLRDRLEHAISASQRDNKTLALIMLDLDRFKEINDTLGHHVGDHVLQQVGQRLQNLLRSSDTVARLGGDEFAILIENTDIDHTRSIARKITEALEQEIDVEDHKLHTGGSLGIALYPVHGEDAATLTRKADVAMYMAKRSNEHFTFYDITQDTHSVAKLSLINDLHNAVERNEMMLYFQPKIDIESNRINGAEALLRWDHPTRGFVPPDEIITLAEYTGLIKPLTLWVLSEALKQCKRWHDAGLEISISVNLSVWNLQDKNLVTKTMQYLQGLQLAPQCLFLEITESAMMADPERSEETLNQLDALGINLSVDDFGTGFSSLAYLKRLPVDELKIDKSFVFNMTANDNDGVIVRSTIDLAHNLGLKVVAEGVETQDALDLLQILGCDTAQGYFISKPVAADDFITWAHEYQSIDKPGHEPGISLQHQA
jgi:diguanylate cyclase (GGDEF)-like protein